MERSNSGKQNHNEKKESGLFAFQVFKLGHLLMSYQSVCIERTCEDLFGMTSFPAGMCFDIKA